MKIGTTIATLTTIVTLAFTQLQGQTAYGKGADNSSSDLSIPKTTEEMMVGMEKNGILKNIDEVYNAKEEVSYLNHYYDIIARLWNKYSMAGGDVNIYLNGGLDSLVVHTDIKWSGKKDFKFEMVNKDSCYSEQSWERFEYSRINGAWTLKNYYSVDDGKKLVEEKVKQVGKPFSPDAMVVTEIIRELTNGDLGYTIRIIYAGREYEVNINREYLKNNPELEILLVDMSNFDKDDMWVDWVEVTTRKSNGKSIPISAKSAIYILNIKFLKVNAYVKLTSVQKEEYITPEKQSISSNVSASQLAE